MPESTSIAVALLAIRLVAGILFFFQGYDKIFQVKTDGVLSAFRESLAEKGIPIPLARFTIVLSSYLELVCGALLALGFFREPVLYALTANMVGVAFAFSALKPMWDMGYYFPRFVLLMALLIIPAELDLFSLTSLF